MAIHEKIFENKIVLYAHGLSGYKHKYIKLFDYKTSRSMNVKVLKISQLNLLFLMSVLPNQVSLRVTSWQDLPTPNPLSLRTLQTSQGTVLPQLRPGFGGRAGASSKVCRYPHHVLPCTAVSIGST